MKRTTNHDQKAPNCQDRASLILISFVFNDHVGYNLRRLELSLKKKFSFQQLGKKKWLENRELKYENFFPVEYMNDKEFVLNHIKKYGYGLKNASTQLQQDREFVLKVVQQKGDELQFASQNILNDKEMQLAAVKQFPDACVFFSSSEFKKDNEFALKMVQQNGLILLYVPNTLENYREIVLAAVKQNGEALNWAHGNLAMDKEIALEAIKQNKKALRFVAEDLLLDYEFMLTALKLIFPEFSHLTTFDYSNKDIMMKLVQENGMLLEFASDELKNDRDIVLNAVNNNGNALEFASDGLKNDIEITFLAVKNAYFALYNVCSEFKSDKQVVLSAVHRHGSSLKFASDDLKNDKEVVMAAVRQNGYALSYASDDMKNDIEVVLQAVMQNIHSIDHANERMNHDKEIILEAIKHGASVKCASQTLLNDKQFLLDAVEMESFVHSVGLYALKFTLTLSVLCLTACYQVLAVLAEFFTSTTTLHNNNIHSHLMDHPEDHEKKHSSQSSTNFSDRNPIDHHHRHHNILILGGRAPVALDYLRMFSEEGHQVHLTETPYYRPMFISNFSTHAKHVHYFSFFPNKDYFKFEDELVEMIKKYSITVLIPTCEEVFHVGRAKNRIEKETECFVFCESIENLKELHNKFEFIEYIEREVNEKFNNNHGDNTNNTTLSQGENLENNNNFEKKKRDRLDETFRATHEKPTQQRQQIRNIQFKAPKTLLLCQKSTQEELNRFWNECSGKIVLKPCYSRFASDTMVKPSKEQALHLLHSQIKECQSSWWVAQEFIEGQILCSFGVATDGILRAHTCYLGGIYTPNGTDVGSSVYFEPLEHEEVDKAIQEWISQLVWHRKYTGQISFDLIVTNSSHGGHSLSREFLRRNDLSSNCFSSSGTITIYPIECNPRATSGAHLFHCDVSHVAGQELRRNFTQCFLPSSTTIITKTNSHHTNDCEEETMNKDLALVSYIPQQQDYLFSRRILKPLPGSRLQIIGGMLMPLWTGCKDVRSCFVWLRDVLCSCGIHRDVLFRANDGFPFLVQFYFILDPMIKKYRYGVGLLNSMTYDIEWNGEEY
nr:unnamed protein product [Naegleria fowleri]